MSDIERCSNRFLDRGPGLNAESNTSPQPEPLYERYDFSEDQLKKLADLRPRLPQQGEVVSMKKESEEFQRKRRIEVERHMTEISQTLNRITASPEDRTVTEGVSDETQRSPVRTQKGSEKVVIQPLSEEGSFRVIHTEELPPPEDFLMDSVSAIKITNRYELHPHELSLDKAEGYVSNDTNDSFVVYDPITMRDDAEVINNNEYRAVKSLANLMRRHFDENQG